MSKDYAVICDKVQQTTLTVQLLKKLKFRKCVIYCSSDESALNLHDYLKSQEVSSVVSVSSEVNFFAPEIYRSDDFINGEIPILITTDQADDVGYLSSVNLILNQKIAADCEEHLRRQDLWFKWKDRNSVCITFLPNKNHRERFFWFIWRKQLEVKVLDVEKGFPQNLLENYAFYYRQINFLNHDLVQITNTNKSIQSSAFHRILHNLNQQ
ncbi:hypothetical protein M3Y94_00703800 [Aphelenchoides besseyi]|nr:hypothetical protein M3Y94_00703800 [Aphelenchoides besseyi]KAI6231642.1 hypothetical protein M3Y95_00403500 [Aphelenchoides besseyi]